MRDALLKVINVTKKFDELVAVDNLSFEVAQGQIYGIAGPNGAGKSTVYNLITGNYSYEGYIEFNGKDITGLSPHQIAKKGIARTFQIPQIFPSLVNPGPFSYAAVRLHFNLFRIQDNIFYPFLFNRLPVRPPLHVTKIFCSFHFAPDKNADKMISFWQWASGLWSLLALRREAGISCFKIASTL